MSKKRTSLEAIIGTPEPSSPQPEKKAVKRKRKPQAKIVQKEESSGVRPLVKQQTAYLPHPVYDQLRQLAFEEKSKMHDYLMEGLDRVFKDRGLKPIKDLTRVRV